MSVVDDEKVDCVYPSHYINDTPLFKPHPDVSNYYVFRDGRIFSLYLNDFLKPTLICGYKTVSIWIDGLGKRTKIHRLVTSLFVDNPDAENLRYINHIDHNKENNNYDNLEWVIYKTVTEAGLSSGFTERQVRECCQNPGMWCNDENDDTYTFEYTKQRENEKKKIKSNIIEHIKFVIALRTSCDTKLSVNK